ncbi:hypothetical protein BBJ28_00014194 [Nothophytophthora sp. Chile5]|nr:hypothetical protein BBJ28_00014194 [Nothophytophthora sp. Chile5]
MYTGMDRHAVQSWPSGAPQPPPQASYGPAADRQSQPGWFPLQEPPNPHGGWINDDGTAPEYAAPNHDHRVYASAPMYAPPPPPYAWADEHPAARTGMPPYLSAGMASYPRGPQLLGPSPPGLYGPQAPPLLRVQEPPFAQTPHHTTIRRRNKEIAIGRWTSDEHQWFLKGLETFQGPAWGEIARLIGSRTSTQVRTHAQKFFTKLARLNQTLPFFEAQIQKERARLLAQGASVTPTAAAQTALHYSLAATLSPRKRVAAAASGHSPRQSMKRPRADAAGVGDAATIAGAFYPDADRAEVLPLDDGDRRKSKEWAQWTEEDSSSHGSRHWAPPQGEEAVEGVPRGPTPYAGDADSLPSMTKLLYRSAAA